MRKQSESQTTGRAGERWFQSVLPHTWILQRTTEDFGIDATVAIGDQGNVSPFEFAVQIKSSMDWTIKGDLLIVTGIRMDALRYWMARLSPTLLVACDVKKECGYYSWVHDVVADVDLRSDESRVTVSVPVAQRLDSSAWGVIERDVKHFYGLVASAFSGAQVWPVLMVAVNTIAESLRSLMLVTHCRPQADNAEKMLALRLTEAIAHREVILTLDFLSSELQIGDPFRVKLQASKEGYRAFCRTMFHPFDDYLASRGKPALIFSNEDTVDTLRPRLMHLANEAVIFLTSWGRREEPNKGSDRTSDPLCGSPAGQP